MDPRICGTSDHESCKCVQRTATQIPNTIVADESSAPPSLTPQGADLYGSTSSAGGIFSSVSRMGPMWPFSTRKIF